MRFSYFFVLVFCTGIALAGDWPQWRGPSRDGHTAADERLSRNVLESKPDWRITAGGGFSSPIIFGNRVVFLDEDGSQEVARCVEIESGKELWRTAFAQMYQDEWGAGPRSSPFTDGKRVYVQSCNGEFRCLDFQTGKVLWGFSFEDYGAKFLGNKAREGTASRRGNNGSGLLDGDAVIVPVGGTDGATLVCLDRNDGSLRWKSGEDEAAYSSLMAGNIAGARQVIAFMADALTGTDRITGKVLWRVPLRTNAKRHAMTPVLDGNRIFVNSHTFGMICFEIVNEGGTFKAVEKWRNAEQKINLATPVLIDGHLYTHGANRNFVCIDAATGKERWSEPGFGQQYSSALAVSGAVLIVTDSGEGIFIKASPEKFEELGRGQLSGKNWNHPAIGNGKLIVKDQRELVCYATR